MADLTENARRQRALAVLLLSVVLIIAYLVIDGVIVERYRFYQTNAEKLQDRLRRLNGVVATRPALDAQMQAATQDNTADAYYLKPSPPTLAASELQQRVKTAVEGNGGSLVSTQVLPVTNEGSFSKIAIRVQINGDTDMLQRLFFDLESKTPLLFVDNVQIRARQVNQRNLGRQQTVVQTTLSTQFELAGYMRGG